MGILILFFTFHLATPIVAQESIQLKKLQKITEKQLGDTKTRIAKNLGRVIRAIAAVKVRKILKTLPAVPKSFWRQILSTYPRRQF
jgi:hypothetical protein